MLHFFELDCWINISLLLHNMAASALNFSTSDWGTEFMGRFLLKNQKRIRLNAVGLAWFALLKWNA